MNPPASISLDLDNLWSYLKTQGVGDWESYPGYLDRVVPRILSVLESSGQKITFFIVGQDASIESNRTVLRQIAEAGHEIANHSFMHEPWLHLYNREQLHEEIGNAEKAIHSVTGKKVRGFRGPGFSTSPLVRDVLAERGYIYDASIFPSALGPLARLFFFFNSRLSPEEKKQRQGLYGKFSDAFGTLQPFTWPNGLVELPVTTMPLLRLPIHTTYLMFLAQKSSFLARTYWAFALWLCRMRGISPSLLLHPTDFLDLSDVPQMAFFPGMKLHAQRKVELVAHLIRTLQQHWQVGTMQQHAQTGVPAAGHSSKLSAQPA